MLGAVSFVMIFAAGLRWRYVGLSAALGVAVLAAGVALKPYRLERIKTFLDPSVDKLGASFQLNQSLIAVGSGGLNGEFRICHAESNSYSQVLGVSAAGQVNLKQRTQTDCSAAG